MSRQPRAPGLTVMIALFVAVPFVIVMFTGEAAWACPACATREPGGLRVFALLGGMILVPYVVAAVTLRIVRRLAKDSEPGAEP